MIRTLSLINSLEIAGGFLFIILALTQIAKGAWHRRLLRGATAGTFVALLAGVAFGRYYASTVPRRLQRIGQSDSQATINLYTEAIRLNPGDPNLYYSRGMTRIAVSQYGEAIADLTRALEIAPSDPVILAARGMVFGMLRDYTSAEKDLDKAAAQYAGKSTPEALVALANIAQWRGQMDGAIGYATQALSEKPNSSDRCDALMYRATAYLRRAKLGDVENALRDSTEAESVCEGPPKEGSLYDQGLELWRLNQPDRALEAWRKALQLIPTDWKVLYNRAKLLTEMGQLAQALSELNRVIELRPDYPDGYRARAEVYSKLGENDRAESDLAMAKKVADAASPRPPTMFLRHGGLPWTELVPPPNDNH